MCCIWVSYAKILPVQPPDQCLLLHCQVKYGDIQRIITSLKSGLSNLTRQTNNTSSHPFTVDSYIHMSCTSVCVCSVHFCGCGSSYLRRRPFICTLFRRRVLRLHLTGLHTLWCDLWLWYLFITAII